VYAPDVLFDLAKHLTVAEAREPRGAEPGTKPVRDFLRELAVGVSREQS
jgi:hypothetical protein